MSVAQIAETTEAFDPVTFIVLRALELTLKEQGGITVEKTLHREQVPSLARRESFIIKGIVLFQASPEIRRIPGVDHPVFTGNQEIHIKSWQPRHGWGSNSACVGRADSSHNTLFQS